MEVSAAGHAWRRTTWHGTAEPHPALAPFWWAVLAWMLGEAMHHAVAAAGGSCSFAP